VLFVDDEIGLGDHSVNHPQTLNDWQQAHHPCNDFNYYICCGEIRVSSWMPAGQMETFIFPLFPARWKAGITGRNNRTERICNTNSASISRGDTPFHQEEHPADSPIKNLPMVKPRFGSSLLEQAKKMVPNLRLLQQGFSRFSGMKRSVLSWRVAEPEMYSRR